MQKLNFPELTSDNEIIKWQQEKNFKSLKNHYTAPVRCEPESTPTQL